MKITDYPQQPADGSDWVAWLRTDDGIHVLVQIGYQADETRAREIVEQFAASGTLIPAT